MHAPAVTLASRLHALVVPQARARAEEAIAAAEATRASEVAAAKIPAEMHRSTGAKLGALLRKQLMRGAEVRKWGGADGLVDRTEFAKQAIGGLGLSATREETDGLFAILDEDGSGALDFDEVKLAMMKLADAADETARNLEMLREQHRMLRDVARDLQRIWFGLLHTTAQEAKVEGSQQVEGGASGDQVPTRERIEKSTLGGYAD